MVPVLGSCLLRELQRPIQEGLLLLIGVEALRAWLFGVTVAGDPPDV
jgi:hypothetical protein